MEIISYRALPCEGHLKGSPTPSFQQSWARGPCQVLSHLFSVPPPLTLLIPGALGEDVAKKNPPQPMPRKDQSFLGVLGLGTHPRPTCPPSPEVLTGVCVCGGDSVPQGQYGHVWSHI